MGFSLADVLSDVLNDVPDLGTGRDQIEYIPLSQLDSDPNNFYQLTKLDELADNIATCGLQQPIRVRNHPSEPGRYMIVSGHRRRAALELLAAEDPEHWQEVPCIVERDAVSPALQQLRVIYGNSSTRVLTAAEISEQAVQVEKLLYQLKEEGHEFPGRMRDHVAQVVQVSKSKLSRLKVIRENLDECWAPHFESNKLHEQTAYYLSQLPQYEQFFIYDYMEAAKGSAFSVSASIVEKYKERLETMKGLLCPTEGIPCENMDNKREATIRAGIYDFHPCSKCCATCHKLTSCRYACPKLADKIAQQKAEAREKKRQEKAAAAEKDAPIIENVRALWRRFGELRAKNRKSVKDVYDAAGGYYYDSDAKRYEERERGEKIDSGTILPFGSIQRYEIEKLIKIADLFDCSLDYLLCRTDEPEPKKNDVPNSGTIWHPISEDPPVGVDLIWVDGHGYSDTGEYMGGQRIETACTIPWDEARWWAMPPTEG